MTPKTYLAMMSVIVAATFCLMYLGLALVIYYRKGTIRPFIKTIVCFTLLQVGMASIALAIAVLRS